ncbi:coiled-coil domain-containing protein 181 isoform X1 [Lepisosteus oculatus]|uniref:coiled-coil domain-containing protein 181 isoform X1 n=1 Tax=Lepisosteus oculatus TaxID=7918 RepID=UPI0035F501AF
MNEKDEFGNRTQEEYEDDFEKDLDWLINEEGKSENEDPEGENDIEAQIDKELEEEEEKTRGELPEIKSLNPAEPDPGGAADGNGDLGGGGSPPSPAEPSEGLSDTDSEGSHQRLRPEEGVDEEELDEEAKKYIMEKIQQANRQLEDEEPADETRERRLKFKDKLVDLVVPPADYEAGRDGEGDVSGPMSRLQISEKRGGARGSPREGKVLVEKDGKFDLVSLREVESQGLLPPLPCASGEPVGGWQTSPRPHSGHGEPCPAHGWAGGSSPEAGHVPKPPPVPRARPNSAGHAQGRTRKRTATRRAQSASNPPGHTTYTLSPEQKELRLKLEQRRERLRREVISFGSYFKEEAKKREEEEQKRQENELAFRAWLMQKKEQLQEQRRIVRAKEMERMNNRPEHPDPQEAFKLWLKRKHAQQLRERQMEEMKRLEEESTYYIHDREECERAFKLWLKRKRAEKRTERLAARERSRRLVMEARRAQRKQDLLCTISEAKSSRFMDNYGYRF